MFTNFSQFYITVLISKVSKIKVVSKILNRLQIEKLVYKIVSDESRKYHESLRNFRFQLLNILLNNEVLILLHVKNKNKNKILVIIQITCSELMGKTSMS